MNIYTKRDLIVRYVGLITAVLLLALLGYTTFRLYPRLAQANPVGSGLLLLAITAGLASLFSPCSFPLLLTILTREASSKSRQSLIRSTLAFTMGVVLFLVLIGAVLAAGAGSFIAKMSFTSTAGRTLRLAVGLVLIGFGLWQMRGQSLNFVWLTRLLQPLWHTQTRWQRQKNVLSYGLYGFVYILAGFG